MKSKRTYNNHIAPFGETNSIIVYIKDRKSSSNISVDNVMGVKPQRPARHSWNSEIWN